MDNIFVFGMTLNIVLFLFIIFLFIFDRFSNSRYRKDIKDSLISLRYTTETLFNVLNVLVQANLTNEQKKEINSVFNSFIQLAALRIEKEIEKIEGVDKNENK